MANKFPCKFIRVSGVECKAETPKAILVKTSDECEGWVPIARISPDSPVRRKGDRGVLVADEWLLKQNGILGEAKPQEQPSDLDRALAPREGDSNAALRAAFLSIAQAFDRAASLLE